MYTSKTALSLMACAAMLLACSLPAHAGGNPYTWRHPTINGGGGSFQSGGGSGPYSGVMSTGQGQAVGNVSDSGNNYDGVYGFLSIRLLESANASIHDADSDGNGSIDLSELLRVIQYLNTGAHHCMDGTEDGYAPGTGDQTCNPHDSDYNPQDWVINLRELLRAVQIHNVGSYTYCPSQGTMDGFCPGGP